MSLNTSRSAAAARLSRQALRHCCRNRNHLLPAAAPIIRPLPTTSSSSSSSSSSSFFSTTSTPRDLTESGTSTTAEFEQQLPRWARTPERMKAPFSPHITRDPRRSQWSVNDDPKKLDTALNRFLGRDGEKLLPNELKWLAITHKSFDQGRRGFNDRLAFLGRQICILEATQLIITSPAEYKQPTPDPFADRRQPFEDPALRSLDNLSENQPHDIISIEMLTKIAVKTGLSDVVRWKPRMPENIQGSGFQPIMAGVVYAIIGAVALQHGGKIASRVVRERVMRKIQQPPPREKET